MSCRGRLARQSIVGAAIVAALTLRTAAVTHVPSADGQFWDIQDTSSWSQDSGGIATGGRANPFNGFGYLKIRVRAGGGTLVPNQYLTGFVLAHDGNGRIPRHQRAAQAHDLRFESFDEGGLFDQQARAALLHAGIGPQQHGMFLHRELHGGHSR